MKTKSFLAFLFLIILASCASRGSLQGGEKDETPPTLLLANPPNESLNSYPTKIELLFDENIKLNNITQNLLVSPILNHPPKISQTAKAVIVELKDTLLENTTYTLNFGNAIADLNENNELSGFTYVFSTGNELDLGKLSGSIIDSKYGEIPEKLDNLWAVLYDNVEDSSFLGSAPKYIAPINNEGNFEFSYLAEGDYKLYAIKDNNYNYYYDLPNEQIAFSDTIYTVTKEFPIQAEKQYLFFPKELTPRIKDIEQKNTMLNIVFNQEANNFIIKDSLGVYTSLIHTVKGDSLTIWKNTETPDNQLYIYNSNKEILDTIALRKVDSTKLDSTLNIPTENLKKNPLSIQYLQFSSPIANIDEEKIVMLEDSLYVAGGLQLKKDSLDQTKVMIQRPFEFGKSYNITFQDSAFVNIYNAYSDSTFIEFTTPKLEDLGTIIAEIEALKTPQIIHLVKDKKIIRKAIISHDSTKQTLRFEHLTPGNYTFNIIIDENGNGKWDTGSFEEKLQPEHVKVYNEPIQVRKNWEVEVLIAD